MLTELAHDPFVQTSVLAIAGALVTHVLHRRYPAGRLTARLKEATALLYELA